MTAIDSTNENEPQKLGPEFVQAVDDAKAEIAGGEGKKKPRRLKKVAEAEGVADARNTPPKPNGGAGKGKKSVAKEIEDLKAEAAPAADPMNRQAAAPKPKSNPFDSSRYRQSQSFDEMAKKSQFLDKLPVGKPKSDKFVRVHAGPEYQFSDVPLYAPSDEKGQMYLLDESNVSLMQAMAPVVRRYTLYYTVTTQGKLLVWPIVQPNEEGKWHPSPKSAMEIAERAKTVWTRIRHIEEVGYVSGGPRAKLKDPKFPPLSPDRIMELAFRGFVIDSFDHPKVRDYLGLGDGSVKEFEEGAIDWINDNLTEIG